MAFTKTIPSCKENEIPSCKKEKVSSYKQNEAPSCKKSVYLLIGREATFLQEG
jgi:hypothetical protein